MRGQDLHKAIVVFRTALELAENIRDHFLEQRLRSFVPDNRFYVCSHRRARGRAPYTSALHELRHILFRCEQVDFTTRTIHFARLTFSTKFNLDLLS
jgi:hypothetical protein